MLTLFNEDFFKVDAISTKNYHSYFTNTSKTGKSPVLLLAVCSLGDYTPLIFAYQGYCKTERDFCYGPTI